MPKPAEDDVAPTSDQFPTDTNGLAESVPMRSSN
jgi:hypothetical protein